MNNHDRTNERIALSTTADITPVNTGTLKMERLHPRKSGDIDYSGRGHTHGWTRRLPVLAFLVAGALVAMVVMKKHGKCSKK